MTIFAIGGWKPHTGFGFLVSFIAAARAVRFGRLVFVFGDLRPILGTYSGMVDNDTADAV